MDNRKNEIGVSLTLEIEGHYPNTIKSFVQGLTAQLDARDYEVILDNAIKSLYIALPNGQENYGGEEPLVATVGFTTINSGPGLAKLVFSSGKNYSHFPLQSTLAEIDLRDKTFLAKWYQGSKKYDENYYQTPETLMKDTEKVMSALGLEKQKIE